MILEGVNFILAECTKMTKEQFIQRHMETVWQDRDKKKRKKMLSDAYDIFNPPKEQEPEAEQ